MIEGAASGARSKSRSPRAPSCSSSRSPTSTATTDANLRLSSAPPEPITLEGGPIAPDQTFAATTATIPIGQAAIVAGDLDLEISTYILLTLRDVHLRAVISPAGSPKRTSAGQRSEQGDHPQPIRD